jgi:hypothetical protein
VSWRLSKQQPLAFQAKFISKNYAKKFTFCELARRYDSRLLKIIIIGRLGAEIYGEQVLGSDVD